MDVKHFPFSDKSSLSGRGVFYVGGSMKGAPDGKQYMGGQMFVEGYEPAELKHPYPIIMFHGAGQTNVNWLTTPDGRPGFADFFLSKGYRVYLAEQPARGRSAYHAPEDGPLTWHPLEDILERFCSANGSWPQARLHDQWPGEPSLTDPAFIQFARAQVDYLPDDTDSQRMVLEAGKELLELAGPAILLTHSQSGPFGWLLGDAYPELVKGIVALEPSGPPFSRDLSSPEARDFGLARLPLHFDPPVTSPSELQLELMKAPREDWKDGWMLREPAPRLPRLRGKPILIMTSEASYHVQYDHLISGLLRQCGVEHDHVYLSDAGIHGNGHMMMLERNSMDIAALIDDWIGKSIVTA